MIWSSSGVPKVFKQVGGIADFFFRITQAKKEKKKMIWACFILFNSLALHFGETGSLKPHFEIIVLNKKGKNTTLFSFLFQNFFLNIFVFCKNSVEQIKDFGGSYLACWL